MPVLGVKMVGIAEGLEELSPKYRLLKISTEFGVPPG